MKFAALAIIALVKAQDEEGEGEENLWVCHDKEETYCADNFDALAEDFLNDEKNAGKEFAESAEDMVCGAACWVPNEGEAATIGVCMGSTAVGAEWEEGDDEGTVTGGECSATKLMATFAAVAAVAATL